MAYRLTTLTTPNYQSSAGYTAEGLKAWKDTVGIAGTGMSGGSRLAGPPPVSTKTYFLYDGETLLMEIDSLGNATAVNTWGANGLVSRRTPSGSVWYCFDERGCTVQRTSETGIVLDSYQTDAYGQVSPTPASTDLYIGLGAQQGYYRDPETGFQLCTYRYYDPLEGRWLTQDPIGMAGGFNLYGYVGGNPVGWSDPSGLICVLNLLRALECTRLAQKIEQVRKELVKRYYDMYWDPLDLYKYSPGTNPECPAKGSWLGHREQFRQK